MRPLFFKHSLGTCLVVAVALGLPSDAKACSAGSLSNSVISSTPTSQLPALAAHVRNDPNHKFEKQILLTVINAEMRSRQPKAVVQTKATPTTAAAPVRSISPTKAAVAPPAAKTAALATPTMTQAAKVTEGGVDNCVRINQGKAAWNCIADQIDKLADTLEKDAKSQPYTKMTVRDLRSAAAEIRQATTKEQVEAALQKVRVALSTAITVAQKEAGKANDYGPADGLQSISATLGKAIVEVQKQQI